MSTLLKIALLSGLVVLAGCDSGKPTVTKEDEQKMDKLFREGIKNPPSENKGQPLNPADQ